MAYSLKKTLMTVTMLSAGFFILSSDSVQAGSDFEQYPKLGEVKDDVNIALDLHRTATSLLSERKQLEEYKASIEKYNEIERRLALNIQCNIAQLKGNFSDAENVWKKVSAWAEDTSSTLLAEASDSLGTSDASSELKAVQNSPDATTTTVASSSSDSALSAINENTTKEEADRLVSKGEKDAKKAEDDAKKEDSEGDIDEAAAFGKVRWDVGFTVLKDIYAYPDKWGRLTKKFSPWVDQKHVYKQYLKDFYEEIQSRYAAGYRVTTNEDGVELYTACTPIVDTCTQSPAFMSAPSLNDTDSFLPEDYYNGEVPENGVSSEPYNILKATADEKWCGFTNGKKNICTRVNAGKLYTLHQMYVQALNAGNFVLKGAVAVPKATYTIKAPYLPQKPLPPWREAVYLVSVKKEIPELASELPDPWLKAAMYIKNFATNGELSNLVEKHGNTLRYRPGDYDSETFEINKKSDGTPRLPIPLMANRVSTYLALVSAKEEQEPVKDKAIASIKEMNENVISTLEKAGYTLPNAATFDLSNSRDYNTAIQKMKELQNVKISSAKAKMQNLQASFSGKLLPSVSKILQEETVTMNALQKDTEFLVSVTRDNAKEINSLILTAVADAVANQTYKDNLDSQMEEATAIPAVGCPVL